MARTFIAYLYLPALLAFSCGIGLAQDEKPLSPPKIYLDRSAKIIAYQLKRLSNERLLQVERNADDSKYLPVFQAILLRDGMPLQQRSDALKAIVILKQSDPVLELLALLESLPDDRGKKRQPPGRWLKC